MRNTITMILSFLFAAGISAQTEKANYKLTADKFEAFYNAGNTDSIFALFSDQMKKALPMDKTTDFFTGLHSQAGNIVKRQFIKYQATYASYKTNFQKALFALNISVDDASKINGLFVRPFTDETLPKIERNTTKLALPFQGEWTVFWGGDTKELNYHVENAAQKNAFDIVVTNEKGKSYRTDGRTNEDYYAFGKELYAPCDGEIVLAVDGVKDNKPGVLNPIFVPGNAVIIKNANNEYLFLAHFKQRSIKVTEGQKVKQGQLLGQCGNSGNSSEPHVHFHLQNVEDMNVATGVKCYFDRLVVNGQPKRDYSPVKGEKIKNE